MLCFLSLPSANHSLKFSALRISSVVVHIKRTGAVANIKAVVDVGTISKTASACRLESELHGSRISSCKYDRALKSIVSGASLKQEASMYFTNARTSGKTMGQKYIGVT